MNETMTFPHVTLHSGLNGIPAVSDLRFGARPQTLSGRLALPSASNSVPGYWFPAGPHHEDAFVDELNSRAGRAFKPDQIHVTMLMAALRNRSSLDELLDFLPGLSAHKLLGAHTVLTRNLAAASTAWQQVHAGARDAKTISAAAKLMPAALSALLNGNLSDVTADGREPIGSSSACRESVDRVMKALDHFPARSIEGVCLGRLLHAGMDYGLFTEPLFIPRRPGELSAERVRALV